MKPATFEKYLSDLRPGDEVRIPGAYFDPALSADPPLYPAVVLSMYRVEFIPYEVNDIRIEVRLIETARELLTRPLDTNTRIRLHSFAGMVTYICPNEALEPGDVIYQEFDAPGHDKEVIERIESNTTPSETRATLIFRSGNSWPLHGSAIKVWIPETLRRGPLPWIL